MKNIIKNIVFSILVTVIFFAILESACRIRAYVKTKDPHLLFYGKSFFELKIKCFANKISDIPGTNSRTREDAEATICTFGGSTTKCTPYVKEKDSWPRLLEDHLNSASGKKITVVNKGYTGADCRYDIGVYRDYLLGARRPPNIAIFYIGLNDSCHIIDYPKDSPRNKVISVRFSDWLNCRLMQTSLLYASLKEKYYKMVNNNINSAWVVKSANSRDTVLNLEEFKDNVETIIKISRDFKIKLILCAEPLARAYLEKNKDIASILHQAIEIMRNIAIKNNIDFIDMNREVYLLDPDFDKFFVDLMHTNEEGNDMIARYFAGYILRRGYLR